MQTALRRRFSCRSRLIRAATDLYAVQASCRGRCNSSVPIKASVLPLIAQQEQYEHGHIQQMEATRETLTLRRASLWFSALLVASLWLLARPYTGVRHDGLLYTAQVLLRLWPEIFQQDLFFAYGSQDRFSVFARLIAQLYVAWGMPTTQMVVLIVCHAAFVSFLALTLRSLRSPVERLGGLVFVAVLSHIYGAMGIFGFAETFITARTLAEPLALAAVAALLAKRAGVAGALLLLSGLVHPLVMIPTAIACWVFLCLKNRRWLWAGLLGLIPVGLAFISQAPFDGLFLSFDSQWWASISEANAHVILSNWHKNDWEIVALDAGILMLASAQLKDPLARWAKALLTTGAGLLSVSAVGADLSHNVLLTSLQVWRVLWLVHLFSLALLASILLVGWSGSNKAKLATLSLAAAVIAVNGSWYTGWAFIAWAAFTQWLVRVPELPAPRIVRWATAVTVIAIVGLTLAIAMKTFSGIQSRTAILDIRTMVLTAASLPVVSISLAWFLFTAWNNGAAQRTYSIAIVSVLTLYGASQWDRRGDWTRLLENGIVSNHPFERLIPLNAQVFWYDEPESTWMLLKRANFVSSAQGSGLLFNRGTALEYVRRKPAMAVLDLQKVICGVMQGLDPEGEAPDCTPDPEVLRDICTMDRGPDYVILKYHLAEGIVAQWTVDAASPSRTYFLYDCLKVR